MKRSLAVILALTMVFTFVACAKGTAQTSGSAPAAPSSSAPASPAAPAPTPSSSEDYEPKTLVMSCQFSAGNVFETQVLKPFEEQLSAATDGKLTIDYYGNNTLVASTEALDACSKGVCDIAVYATAYSPGQLPITFLVEYPQEFRSAKAASYAMRDWLDDLKPVEYDNDNVIRLMNWTTGEGAIATKGVNIKSLDNFKGMEIRGNSIMVKAINAWGGTGVTTQTAEAYESMNSGIIDGSISGMEAVTSLGLYDICDYCTQLTVFNASFLMVMNKNTFESLPAEWQTALIDTSKKVFDDSACDYMERQAYRTGEALAKRGIDITVLDPDVTKQLKDACAPLIEEYAAELDKQGLDGTGALKKLREYADKYNQMYPDSSDPWWKNK